MLRKHKVRKAASINLYNKINFRFQVGQNERSPSPFQLVCPLTSLRVTTISKLQQSAKNETETETVN